MYVNINISAIKCLSAVTITYLIETGTLPTTSHTHQHNPDNYRSNQGWWYHGWQQYSGGTDEPEVNSCPPGRWSAPRMNVTVRHLSIVLSAETLLTSSEKELMRCVIYMICVRYTGLSWCPDDWGPHCETWVRIALHISSIGEILNRHV
jgi:hypothetical protein